MGTDDHASSPNAFCITAISMYKYVAQKKNIININGTSFHSILYIQIITFFFVPTDREKYI